MLGTKDLRSCLNDIVKEEEEVKGNVVNISVTRHLARISCSLDCFSLPVGISVDPRDWSALE